MAQNLRRFGVQSRSHVFIAGSLSVVALMLTLQSCASDEATEQVIPTNITNIDTGTENSVVSAPAGDEESSLTIRLSEGLPQPEQTELLSVATGEPLSDEEIDQILARLPELTADPADLLDFNLPEDSLPPPRSGETIEETFPPPLSIEPEMVATGPLQVLRFAPEGEIPIAPFVNLTFNQPMVPLTTIEDLALEEVPVLLEPALPGIWRWLGTKTLTFEYDSALIDRLPMATEYQVTVPAGTESVTGGALAEAVEYSFRTPAPSVTITYPYDTPQPLEPIFFISFDQRIDPQAVLDSIQVTAGSEIVDLQLATEAEIKADEAVSSLVENALEARWLAFRATEPFSADTSIGVSIGPGTPSAEGPLITTEAQYYSFYTFAPFEIAEQGCSWWDDRCPPLTPFLIRFNNSIDTDSYTDDMLTIEPELSGASAEVFGNTITIRGATEGRTTYRITVAGEIKDIFGQTLGDDERLTFRVGSAEPILVGPDGTFITLDPAASAPALSLYTINYNRLDVQIYAVEPADWSAFKEYLRDYQQTDDPRDPPGRLVRDETMRLNTEDDVLTEIGVELSGVLDGDFGHFIVIAKPPRGLFQEERYWEIVQTWVQVTQIGLDAFVDHSEMVVWASALQDGAPLAGVSIESDAGALDIVTGEDGLARFDIPAGGAAYLVAHQGADQALLPRSSYYWGDDTWYQRTVYDYLSWYVFDDRQMYRPGEEVTLKGWLRNIGGGQGGDVGLLGDAVSSLSYQLVGPQGNELGNGKTDVNALGGFDFSFTLPENVNLGYAQLYLQADSGLNGSEYYHSFQIQEFRRPEFEVSARNETVGPYFVGDHAILAVEAKYFSGGPLPNAETSWRVTSSPSNYQPPNWPEFNFGTWTPWWWYYDSDYGESSSESFSSVTDASGTHYLRLDFDGAGEPRPFSVLAEATVIDVNRQAWASTTSLLVHPADLYVGMRSERYFVERGTPLEIKLIVTDLDGNTVSDLPIHVSAAWLEWKYSNGSWGEEQADVQECTIGSTDEPVSCTFETPLGGRYQITASVTDTQGRPNQSRMTRWVSGGQQPPAREVEQEIVTLIPDKEIYQPGDVAEILVQAPFKPAEGLLTVSRSGILYTERFDLSDGTITLQVPIEDAHIPNLNVQVDVVGAALRTDDQGETIDDAPSRPAFATGQLNLSVPPLQRTLALQVTPQETELEPGGETTIDLVLEDANGRPVAAAALAVVVVDEAILALTNYQLADPVSVFYQQRSSDLSSTYGRASIILADPLALAAEAQAEGELALQATQGVAEEEAFAEAAPAAAAELADAESFSDDRAGAGGEANADSTPIQVRADFNPLATFAPSVRTDSNGIAQVTVNLPDNLTRYRVMVIAVDASGAQFGSAEANLTARLPLMVRPSAPRFLNFGDVFELPIVLQNQTDEALVVEAVAAATNIAFIDSPGVRVTVPANDRVEVRFPSATELVGTARFQIVAVSGSFADAATIELPVYTPATTEAFAVYGVIDEGAVAQPVAAPSNVFPQFGGLEINTSSTALQALTDAVLYLVAYPFECSEQLSSRILGVAALRDVLTAFEAEGLPAPEEMEAAVERDIERLVGLQNWDGGFPYWRRGRDSIPFNSIHVAHALQRAKLKGFDVPEGMQSRALDYLRDIESYYPSWYSQRTRQTLSAYALYVRNLMGDRDVGKARDLYAEAGLEDLSLDAVGWLWAVLQDDSAASTEIEAIRRHVNNRAVETAGAANFTTAYDEQTYLLLSSNRRTDAILLDTLIADSPQSDLNPKLVNGLLAHRKQGRWGNTQENVFVLLALDRYFNTFESQTPDFVARIWLGDTYAGDHEYSGRSTERHETEIPMAYLVDPALGGGETQDLILSKDGPGRLYYRLGLRYAPTELSLDPLDMGFVVQRSYEAVNDPEDVHQDEDGVWHIRAGARVRVRLKMVADNRRYHVALVDPLPAGLEIVNPALAVSGSAPQDPSSSDYRYGWWWWGTWYEHQNMRDERAEAFTSLLWDGVYDYTYIARATTPGVFIAPPAKAEEMYSPEVFGRSGSDWVVVK